MDPEVEAIKVKLQRPTWRLSVSHNMHQKQQTE